MLTYNTKELQDDDADLQTLGVKDGDVLTATVASNIVVAQPTTSEVVDAAESEVGEKIEAVPAEAIDAPKVAKPASSTDLEQEATPESLDMMASRLESGEMPTADVVALLHKVRQKIA